MSADELFKAAGTVANATGNNPGGGKRADAITDALSKITGAYEVITGSGLKNGPAPDVKASDAGTKPNYLVYGAIGLGVAVVLWLLLKKK